MNLYDKSLEKKVLGQLLIEPDAYLRIADILTATDFYSTILGQIFEVIESLFKDNKAIDIITVTNEAKARNLKISAFEIVELTDGVAGTAHLEYHARILKDFSIRRQLLNEISKLKEIGNSPEYTLDDFMQKSITFVDKVIGDKTQSNNIKDFKENVKETIEAIKERQGNNAGKFGYPPSLNNLSKFIPLWKNGNLIIIAARPGMGKTAFAIHELFHLSHNFGPILYFSLEMSANELIERILQRETHFSQYDFDHMTSEKWNQLDSAVSKIINAQFFIDDTPGVSIDHVKAKTKIFKKIHNIKAIAIDYLQLMTADKNLPRERQVSEISRNMKLIAKEFNIPVFLVAQLNRGPETRKEDLFRPKLSDLRESGSIEQDADIVIFPHRPAYYYPKDPDFKGKADLLIAKNRNGNVGVATVKVNDTITKFYDIITTPEEFQNSANSNDVPF